jgi:PAS domain S-box-containing protein
VSSILVVDDRAIERELLVTVLGYAGHAVAEASTGEAALALARKLRPDLIIADMMMPGMDGSEFAHLLRGDPNVGNTRIVICTATYDEHEISKLAETVGVSHILVKPCEPQEIIDVVTAALGTSAGSVSEEFGPEQLRVLNAKLVQKVSELEVLNAEQNRLHEQLRQAERQTAESLTLLETLQSSAPVGFGFVDREFRVVRMNETLAATNGSSAEQQIGRTIPEIVPELWPQLEPVYRQVLATGTPIVNLPVQGEGPAVPGAVSHWLTSYYPVRLNAEVIGIGIVVVDITERQEADDFRSVVMENIAEGLYVTDAQGRLIFMNASAATMTGWSEAELHGKSVHEAFHHQHADGTPFAEHDCQLLRCLSDGRTVRIADDTFTRRDGTLFHFAGSAAPLASDGTVRGSVVVFRDTTEEHEEQLRVQRELDSVTWVGRIREALDEERLVLYSQPIISLTERAHDSMELLVRMIGRDGELISPGSFLPVAEKYGQIVEIDRWVVRQAARLAAGGRHLHANLSAVSIVNLDLVRYIADELSEAGADPTNVVFEITETALMNDLESGEAFARAITEIGCGLALDDFGTGYGSLTYLRKLPITFLKIDIEFVRDLVTNAASQHLVSAIVNIAAGFGQQTIAEGVEDRETLDSLRGYGVDLAQGFHLGRPAPLEVGGD